MDAVLPTAITKTLRCDVIQKVMLFCEKSRIEVFRSLFVFSYST